MSLRRTAIIVHGGAGPIGDEELPQRLEGCRKAALVGWNILQQGGSALDGVEAALSELEDNPLFNAGTGSTLNSLGQVEMDAAIMDGSALRAGAVAAVSGIKNPIKLARRIMEDGRHVLLVGEGARFFARQMGIPECVPDTLIVEETRRRWREKHGTVGCAALDQRGRISAATSTGGMFDKLPGRVGDSPLIGCGTYADEVGGASCTGHGEAIIHIVMAKTAIDDLRRGAHPMEAARSVVSRLEEKTGSKGGLIIVSFQGVIGYARSSNRMPVCWVTGGGDVLTDS